MHYDCGMRHIQMNIQAIRVLLCFCCGLVSVNFNYIPQGYFTGTGAIIGLPKYQWSKPERYAKMNHKNLPGTHDMFTAKQTTGTRYI